MRTVNSKISALLIAVILIITALFPMTAVYASETETPAIIVSSASGNVNDTVPITISLANNPGIISMRLFVNYDSSLLELVSAADAGMLGSSSHSDNKVSPYTLAWFNGAATSNITSNGVVATLYFKIIAEITSTPVSVSSGYKDIINIDLQEVGFSVTNGSVNKASTSPVQLAAPAGLSWSGTVSGRASWQAVANASGYSVQLYKNGSASGASVSASAEYYDFASVITETGAYTFKVTAVGDGVNYTNSAQSALSGAYNYSASAVKLATPTGLSWSSSIPGRATWQAVANASGYTVQLYRNGAAIGSPVVTTAAYYNFASLMTVNGAYTFKVTAVGDGVNYTDSSQSASSGVYNYTSAAQLPTPTGLVWSGSATGRAIWSPVTQSLCYSVQLYKNYAEYGSPVITVNTYYDFSLLINETGSYTFKVTAIGDGTNYANSAQSSFSGVYNYTLTAVKLAAPSSLSWSASAPGRAAWSSVTHSLYYSVQLYKNNALFGTPAVTVNTYYDFSSVIKETGLYTFRVTAIGDGINYSDSTASSTSPAYDYNSGQQSDWVNPFTDVSSSSRYYSAVENVNTKGLFIGVSATEFGGALTMTRAMFVTVLGRMAGVNQALYKDSVFSDVLAGSYYSKYVSWAESSGIVLGYGDNKFGPDDNVTVEQAHTIIFRYAEYINKASASLSSIKLSFDDTSDISSWAVNAVKFAVKYRMTDVVGSRLNPRAFATRYNVAYMIWKFNLNIEQ